MQNDIPRKILARKHAIAVTLNYRVHCVNARPGHISIHSFIFFFFSTRLFSFRFTRRLMKIHFNKNLMDDKAVRVDMSW